MTEAKPSLFDDDSEEEYKPVELDPEEQVPEQNPYNPYAQEEAQEQVLEVIDSTTQPAEQAVVEQAPGMIEEVKSEQTASTSGPALSESDKFKLKMLEDISQSATAQDNQIGATEDEDRIAKDWAVTKPLKVGSVVKYTVQGTDSNGTFEVVRRFNEFHALRASLVEGWPGCFIPCIPEKKTLAVDTSGSNMTDWSVGSTKEGPFIEMRRALFERFIREVAKFEYLVESREFQLFARQAGEVDKPLKGLPTQTPMQILEKYRLAFKIDEDQDPSTIAKYREKINMFIGFLKKAHLMMEKAKENLKEMVSHHDKQNENYLRMYFAFNKYEDIAIDYFSDCDVNKRLFTHPGVGDVKEKISEAFKGHINAYRDAYIWMKGEQLDCTGMLECLQGRENVMKKQMTIETKRRDNKAEVDKLEMNKTSFKNFFKSKNSKDTMKLDLQQAIEVADRNIEEYRKLVNFLTCFHGQNVIDTFKANKVSEYKRMLRAFSVHEINNCHSMANMCHMILQLEEMKN